MKADAVAQLTRVLHFVNDNDSPSRAATIVPRSAVVAAVDKCAFERMRQVRFYV